MSPVENVLNNPLFFPPIVLKDSKLHVHSVFLSGERRSKRGNKNRIEESYSVFHPETNSTRNESIQLQAIPSIITTMPTTTATPRFQIIQLQAVSSGNGIVQAFQSRNENIRLSSSRVVQAKPSTSRSENTQKSRNETAQPSSVSNGSIQQCSAANDNLARNYSCLVCNVSRSGHEIRHTSYKRQQNIVLLACLQAQNIIDMDMAKVVYKELLRGRKRICHDHYMQAVSFFLLIAPIHFFSTSPFCRAIIFFSFLTERTCHNVA